MFPSNIFDDVSSNYQYLNEDGLDVFVFKFPNGRGAIVSKPEGNYKRKINVWILVEIRYHELCWDLENFYDELAEIDIVNILSKIKTES